MAGRAVHDRGLDIQMGLRKRAAAEVMAVGAQRRERLRIQRGLLRKMRQMAFQAIARGRGMGPARFQFRLERFMTDETQIGAFRQKEFGHLRLVRAVALGTFALHRRRMRARRPGPARADQFDERMDPGDDLAPGDGPVAANPEPLNPKTPEP